MTVDATAVVGPVVERMTVRRLGGAGITLGAAFALGLAEWALRDLSGAVHALAVSGPIACAGILVALGFRGVRRAFGDPVRPWMSLASVSAVVPFAFGLWLFAVRGLRSFAVSAGPDPAWLFHAAWALVGLRLLRDTSRVMEMERLAATMVLPAPGEADRGR